MRLYRGPRDNEPRARQSTGARGGMGDGFRHKHQPQIQRGTRKERSRRGLGWPTQQLALRFIQSIDRLFRSFPVRQGQGKTREDTLLPNTRARPLALQKTRGFLQGACLHLLQINSDNKQCQQSRSHGEGPLGPDAEIHQGKLREATGRRTRVASPAGFPAFSSSVQQPHPPI